MKKILTILAASAMFFAFGEDISNGINFEAYTAYGEGSFNPLGDDPGTESQYWYSASSVGNVISNHVAAPVLPSGVTVPDLFKDDNSNTNFLYLETEAPLFRTVKTNGHDPASFGDSGVLVTENPIYLDTLVKFTAADSAFTSFEDAADKIAIEYVEHEEESHEDPEHGLVIDSAGFTNFVIRAGYVVAADNSATIVETNYYVAVPEGFDKDAWHRLTVRSIANIDGTGTGKGHVGFVVYLDQVPLKYATSVAVGNATFESNLNADVKKNFYNSETPIHALYPSAVDPEELTGQKISAVAFSGNGSVDDVVFTTTKPGFINESSIVTVTWDAHVATLTLNGNAVEGFVAGTAGNANVEPENGVVLVAATFANGWEAGTFTTDGDGSWDSATSSFVDLASGETCNIVSMFPYFEVNGVKYEKVTDAVTAAQTAGTSVSPATIKLLADVNKSIQVTGGYVVIDLAGKTITDAEGDGYAIYNDGADLLIITNSTVEVGHVVPADGAGTDGIAIAINAATTTIAGGVIDGIIDGAEAPYLVITAGGFYDGEYEPDDEESEFYLAGFVATGLTVTYEEIGGENYFRVGGGDTPTTFALTTTGGANATITTDPADVSALTEETEVTITSTPETGYTYNGVDVTDTGFTYDSESDTISKTLIVSADTEVAVPGAVSPQQSGYDSGDGEHTFVIDSATEDELEDNLPTGKTLASPVSEGSSLTYAQAYALGLWDATATTVTDLDATISVGADGKVTVTLANAPTSGYLVQCKVYEKASLTAEWPSTPVATYAYGSEQAFTPASATAGFYKVAVVITNALN